MSTATIVRARIDPEVKAQATEALDAMGLTLSEAIRLLLVRVAHDKELPFAVKVPNAVTLRAMRELEEGKGKQFESAEDLFEDLGL